MCGWVTLLYSRKLIEHCKPTITEKIKIINHLKKKKKTLRTVGWHARVLLFCDENLEFFNYMG